MRLGFGLTFEQLHQAEGMAALDARFLSELGAVDAELHQGLIAARGAPERLTEHDHSALLMALAPHAEHFLARLFGIEEELSALQHAHAALQPLYACKRLFVQRRAAKTYTREAAESLDGAALTSAMTEALGGPFDELVFARNIMAWLKDEPAHADKIELALRYAAWALFSDAGKARHRSGVLFYQPKKLDYRHLIELCGERQGDMEVLHAPPAQHRVREGFALTDPKGTLAQALDEAHYCIYCHHQEKDSCSKGLREKDGAFRVNPLGITLSGCPLSEKISEMNELKSAACPLGALAVVVVDNPMCAGTGHRICNDCMKSCIYQKQEPVDIPLAETRVLDDVLALPYGFEIYALLTRWNPLNFARPLPKPDTGRRVLVVGLGPAGYTLSHHLLNDGHIVLAIDGLKLEPLDAKLLTSPIKDVAALREPLDQRTPGGFGGVAEYGITPRWDKNYLTLIRLLLERRAQFRAVGGVRFGSTLGYDDAFALGFDHIALCMGAGSPNLLTIPNGLARGVRTASDFLMGLQLTGAAREASIANLQLRLPVVVIGGGLTAIDTATEALAYYPVQVEKFLARYEALGKDAFQWTEEEAAIAEEFFAHARALQGVNDKAALVKQWGGVRILYRKRLEDAPSYRLNHEEVEKAFEEGIGFVENVTPEAVETDRFGHAESLRVHDAQGEAFSMPARTILIAAGTSPNTVLAREDEAHFFLDGRHFRAVDEQGAPVSPERLPKPAIAQVLMHAEADGRAVSFFGDLHPSFAGNVVKAMASAKQGYPVVSRMLAKISGKRQVAGGRFLDEMQGQLTATVHEVNRLNRNIVEVVVHAPLAAARFQPGQFYRLQNYEQNALTTCHLPLATTLAMEGLAMTGAEVDKKRGLVSVIVLEMGGSSNLAAHLKPGEQVVLMGPTGAPTHIPERENVLLAGGGLGNAVLFSIGKAFRARGGRVLYFAAYRRKEDRFKQEEIEAAADAVVWVCEEATIAPSRPQDRSFQGTIIQAMTAYAEGRLGALPLAMEAIKRVIAIGSDGMMAAVKAARHGALKPYLRDPVAIGSINSPMQCMMKEICAQCLQAHKDPETGEIRYVYSCFNQDQCLDEVDFPLLRQRLAQNAVQEKLTAQWIQRCLEAG